MDTNLIRLTPFLCYNLSDMDKRWVLYPKTSEDLTEQLLNNRQIQNREKFLNPLLTHLTDSRKLFPEIEKATERIKRAIKNKELVYIYGDYDVDGITGSAILWETINFLGGEVMPYIPSRHSEGYGLHTEALKHLAKKGAKVVISVDCGVTAIEQSKLAKKINIDLIITDHHQPQESLPKPYALIHTTSLSGSGVAFRLAENLLENFGKSSDKQFFRNLELASLGTVADMVPLTNDNRIIVSNGLSLLSKTERLGLQALYQEAGVGSRIGIYEVGFAISPRLNAMGRMQNALDSLRLLLTRDKVRAEKLALNLSKINKDRQDQTKRVFDHAKSQIEKKFSEKSFLIVESENYPEGVVGLVASRLVETFYKPTAVIGKGEKVFKGSARSIGNFNITQAISTQEKILVSHGGHPMAAGFSIEGKNIPKFRENLEDIAKKDISDDDFIPKLKVDWELKLNEIDQNLLKIIKQLEPFGIGNPEPVFLTKVLEIVEVKRIGKESQHLRLFVKDSFGNTISGVGFGFGSQNFTKGEIIDVVYNLRENTWNSRKTIEARIKDIKKQISI